MNSWPILIQGNYGTYILDKDGFCTCPGNIWNGKCKHQKAISMIEDIDLPQTIKKYPSSLEGLNTIFDGGLYNTDEIICFYGLPDTGKSLFIYQDAYYLASLGLNILIVTNETGEKQMINDWRAKFRQRWPGKGRVFVEQRLTFESFYEYLGFRATVFHHSKKKAPEEGVPVEQSEEGQLVFSAIQTYEEPLIDRDIAGHKATADNPVEMPKIDVVFIDSVTAQAKLSFGNLNQNYPHRSSAMATCFKAALRIKQNFNIPICTTAHATAPLQYSGSIVTDMYGGLVIHHFCKYVIYVDKREAIEYANYRRFWVIRSGKSPKFEGLVIAKVDNSGFSETKDIDLTSILTTGEIDKGMAGITPEQQLQAKLAKKMAKKAKTNE